MVQAPSSFQPTWSSNEDDGTTTLGRQVYDSLSRKHKVGRPEDDGGFENATDNEDRDEKMELELDGEDRKTEQLCENGPLRKGLGGDRTFAAVKGATTPFSEASSSKITTSVPNSYLYQQSFSRPPEAPSSPLQMSIPQTSISPTPSSHLLVPSFPSTPASNLSLSSSSNSCDFISNPIDGPLMDRRMPDSFSHPPHDLIYSISSSASVFSQTEHVAVSSSSSSNPYFSPPTFNKNYGYHDRDKTGDRNNMAVDSLPALSPRSLMFDINRPSGLSTTRPGLQSTTQSSHALPTSQVSHTNVHAHDHGYTDHSTQQSSPMNRSGNQESDKDGSYLWEPSRPSSTSPSATRKLTTSPSKYSYSFSSSTSSAGGNIATVKPKSTPHRPSLITSHFPTAPLSYSPPPISRNHQHPFLSRSSSSSCSFPRTHPPPSPYGALVGSWEHSLLTGRLSALPSHPFTFQAEIGVLGTGKNVPKGLRCPTHLKLDFGAYYYELPSNGGNVGGGGSTALSGGNGKGTPYVGTVDLEAHYWEELWNLAQVNANNGTHLAASTSYSGSPVSVRSLASSPPVFNAAHSHNGRGSSLVSSPGSVSHQAASGEGGDHGTTSGSATKSRKTTKFPGYRVPPKGQIQVIVRNPNKAAVKLFFIPYDLEDMQPGTKTFVRQKTYVKQGSGPTGIGAGSRGKEEKESDKPREKEKETLMYAIHLQFCAPPKKSSRFPKTTRRKSTQLTNSMSSDSNVFTDTTLSSSAGAASSTTGLGTNSSPARTRSRTNPKAVGSPNRNDTTGGTTAQFIYLHKSIRVVFAACSPESDERVTTVLETPEGIVSSPPKATSLSETSESAPKHKGSSSATKFSSYTGPGEEWEEAAQAAESGIFFGPSKAPMARRRGSTSSGTSSMQSSPLRTRRPSVPSSLWSSNDIEDDASVTFDRYSSTVDDDDDNMSIDEPSRFSSSASVSSLEIDGNSEALGLRSDPKGATTKLNNLTRQLESWSRFGKSKAEDSPTPTSRHHHHHHRHSPSHWPISTTSSGPAPYRQTTHTNVNTNLRPSPFIADPIPSSSSFNSAPPGKSTLTAARPHMLASLPSTFKPQSPAPPLHTMGSESTTIPMSNDHQPQSQEPIHPYASTVDTPIVQVTPTTSNVNIPGPPMDRVPSPISRPPSANSSRPSARAPSQTRAGGSRPLSPPPQPLTPTLTPATFYRLSDQEHCSIDPSSPLLESTSYSSSTSSNTITASNGPSPIFAFALPPPHLSDTTNRTNGNGTGTQNQGYASRSSSSQRRPPSSGAGSSSGSRPNSSNGRETPTSPRSASIALRSILNASPEPPPITPPIQPVMASLMGEEQDLNYYSRGTHSS